MTRAPWARLSPRTRVLIPAALVAVMLAALAIGAIGGGPRPERRPVRATGTSPSPAASSTVPTVPGPPPPKDDPALWRGTASAPVTVVEFGDFQCPSCGSFARRTEAALRRRYVDTGVVRFVWRDYPWIGKESMRAAIAARAAARQGRFWQFHDALYAHQFPEKSGRLTDAHLRGVARRVGLDLTRYDADRRDPAVARAVRSEYGFAQAIGLPGTPSFFINGELFFGDQPLKAFVKAIETARRER